MTKRKWVALFVNADVCQSPSSLGSHVTNSLCAGAQSSSPHRFLRVNPYVLAVDTSNMNYFSQV